MRRQDRRYRYYALCLGSVLWLSACDQSNNTDNARTPSSSLSKQALSSLAPENPFAEQKTGLITPNELVAKTIERAYLDAIDSLRNLKTVVHDMLVSPDEQTLAAAQAAWRQAHDAYLVADAARQLNIPHPVLDHEQTEPEVVHSLPIKIDQYPMIPGYLDSVAGYPKSGLIHSEMRLDFETLNAEHQFSDRAYVTLGFHALEFMLFGDIESKQPRSGDFVSGSDTSDNPAATRRQAYTRFLVQQLTSDLGTLAQAWSDSEGFYRNYVRVLITEDLRYAISQGIDAEKSAQTQTNGGHMPAEIGTMRLNFLSELEELVRPENASEPAAPDTQETSDTQSPE